MNRKLKTGIMVEIVGKPKSGSFPVRNPRTGKIDWIPAVYFEGFRVFSPAALLGSIKSKKKAKSSRKNGKLGGRPKIIRIIPLSKASKLKE